MMARIGAGVAASAVTTPFIAMLAGHDGAHLMPIALLTAATGVVGAQASYLVTRREITTWMARMSQRTERLFRREPGQPAPDPVDFERYLYSLAGNLEITLERQISQERDALLHTITSLASALEARDPFTRNHSANVAKFAVRVGKQMGLPRAELYEIHLAGLLHDIGKIGVPDAILLKPAGLTREEYEVMKTHPVLGARIISGIPGLEAVTKIVLHHHEMWNGLGYPDGIAGRDIPVGARIIAASDTYLSMVEDRPYRAAQRLDRVFRELRRVAGEQLDPDVVEALLLMIQRETETFGSPLMGNYESLSTGEEERTSEAA
jgi:putative nucleotidyltransferase with HDIG domain